MGGQACVLYGAAEFSRDTDLVILADERNLARLRRVAALRDEEADEREADRRYWAPLRSDLERMRHRLRR